MESRHDSLSVESVMPTLNPLPHKLVISLDVRRLLLDLSLTVSMIAELQVVEELLAYWKLEDADDLLEELEEVLIVR